jgi:alkanesulfonate monooxygenase SsuD/methylene tetrahydromethanopterin reductase-like flavin-dependent oxidoreductase (luciferase family)
VDLEVVLPDESPDMAPETLVELAEAAERLGYRTLYLPDHLLPPAPYGDTYGGVYEPLVTLAHLAAHTSTIRLGTSVLVLPMRSPFVVAKQVATLDRLSGGRAVLGVGVGWDRSEFAAVGAEFATRGARTDEDIALLRHLFRDGGPFHGRFHHVEQGVFAPVPARPGPYRSWSEGRARPPCAGPPPWPTSGRGWVSMRPRSPAAPRGCASCPTAPSGSAPGCRGAEVATSSPTPWTRPVPSSRRVPTP